MREFYEDILHRREAGKSLSPLDRVVLLEAMTPEDRLQQHKQALRQILEQLDRREAEAREFGSGQPDWAVAALHKALHSGNLRNKRAAEIYPLLRQGLTTEELAAKLGLTREETLRAENRLMILYRRIVNRSDETQETAPGDPRGQLFLQLMRGKYRVFRRSDTGVVQYRFYHRAQLLGTGSAQVLPDFPIVLRCNGLLFNSSFDPKTTVFPGLSRDITDGDDPSLVAARLTWLTPERQELRLNWTETPLTVRIHSRENAHRFYVEDRLIAEILPLPQKQSMFDWELSSCMQVYEDISDETALFLMSFPLLRFAL